MSIEQGLSALLDKAGKGGKVVQVRAGCAAYLG
jgi:hypothetical protein